jgi:hypothetical protein
MHAVVCGERMLTDLDFARLTTLLGQELSGALCGMLDGVDVVSPRDVPGDVVTMYSRVEIVDVHTSRRQVLTVCYPCDAQPAAGFISVLSPEGSRHCQVAHAQWRDVRCANRGPPLPARRQRRLHPVAGRPTTGRPTVPGS